MFYVSSFHYCYPLVTVIPDEDRLGDECFIVTPSINNAFNGPLNQFPRLVISPIKEALRTASTFYLRCEYQHLHRNHLSFLKTITRLLLITSCVISLFDVHPIKKCLDRNIMGRIRGNIYPWEGSSNRLPVTLTYWHYAFGIKLPLLFGIPTITFWNIWVLTCYRLYQSTLSISRYRAK